MVLNISYWAALSSACDITLDRLNRYVADRLARGIAPATAQDVSSSQLAGRAIILRFRLFRFRMPERDFSNAPMLNPFGHIYWKRIAGLLPLHT